MKKRKKLLLGIALGFLLFAMALIPGWEIVIRSPFVIRRTTNFVSPALSDEEVEELKEALQWVQDNKHSEEPLFPEKEAGAKEPEGETTHEIIDLYADFYGVNRKLAHCIVMRESSYNPLAEGDWLNGEPRAIGLWQWHLGSYQFMRKQMGEETSDQRKNVVESTKTALYAIANGYANWWTPYLKGVCR